MRQFEITFWAWRAVTIAGVLMCACLWFGLLSDYSFTNSLLNLACIPLVFIIGILAVWSATRAPTHARRLRRLLLGLPGFLSGLLLTTLLLGVSIVFFPAIIMNSTPPPPLHLQRTVSPNGLEVADVYFQRPALSVQSLGAVYVRVTYPFLPFIERNVYEASVPEYTYDHPVTYVAWQDNDTLSVRATHTRIHLGLIHSVVQK